MGYRAPEHLQEDHTMIDAITSIPGYHLYILLIVIAISSGIHLSRLRAPSRARVAEVILMYAIGIIGFNGFTSFVAHTVFADQIAASIGWPAGNLFQLEVAGANLGIGLIGFLGFFRRDFWLPFILAKFGFSWTAGAAHVIDIVQHANFSVNNAGPILYWDFLIPPLLLALYLIQRRGRSDERGIIRTSTRDLVTDG
jgi:hypothetical protein